MENVPGGLLFSNRWIMWLASQMLSICFIIAIFLYSDVLLLQSDTCGI